eukprot:1360724-Alexandrium_andersonii.AAC.1
MCIRDRPKTASNRSPLSEAVLAPLRIPLRIATSRSSPGIASVRSAGSVGPNRTHRASHIA